MEKIKVAFASVLKPLKDPRSYYRMGLSLRETNKYLINIIGFSIKNKSNEDLINFSPVYCQKRNHWKRFLVSLKFIKILLQQPPKILIVSTYELLFAAVLLKPFLRFKLIYDVQENYCQNLRFNQTLSFFWRRLLITYVKSIETISKPFIDHYFFAEACYQDELPNTKNFSILENKFHGDIYPRKPISFDKKTSYIFLISGTLTEVYGILEGIKWFEKILMEYPDSKLRLIGHVPMSSYKSKILREIKGNESVEIHLSEYPIAYESILKSYKGVDFVLMPYHQIPSISPKIPSKFYEASALGIPSLFSPNPKWQALAKPNQAGAEMDFFDLQNPTINFSKILQKEYFTSPVSNQMRWKSDEAIFLKVISDLGN